MPWLETKDKQRIYYSTYGDGKPLIFIHGWIISSVVWNLQKKNPSNYKLIFVDLRGQGRSSSAKGPYVFSRFADDIELLIVHLKLEKPVLVGWSMGAMIALEYIKDRGSSISGLVLVNATPCFMRSSKLKIGVHPDRVKRLKEGLAHEYRKTMRLFCESIFTQKEKKSDEVNRLLKKIFESKGFPPATKVVNNTLEELTSWNQSDLFWLKNVDTRSLIIHGAKDNVIPVESGRELNSLIPDSKLVIFDEAGHAPFISESARFNSEINLFMESIDSN